MSRYLITGGAGFIGSHLLERLLPNAEKVIVIDAFKTTRNMANLREALVGHSADKFHVETLDLAYTDQRTKLSKLVASVDTVFHLAAIGAVPRSMERPHEVLENNIRSTLNVLETCRLNGKPMMFASSASVHAGTSPYAASKRAGEELCRAYRDSFGLKVWIHRFQNVYGPRQSVEHALIPKTIWRLLRGKAPEIYEGQGSQERTWYHVNDVIFRSLAQLGFDYDFKDEPGSLYAVKHVTTNVDALVKHLQAVVPLDGLNPADGKPYSFAHDTIAYYKKKLADGQEDK